MSKVLAQTITTTFLVETAPGIYYLNSPTLTLNQIPPRGERGYKSSYNRLSQTMVNKINSDLSKNQISNF